MSEVDVAALRKWAEVRVDGRDSKWIAEQVLAALAEIEGLRERLARQDAVVEDVRRVVRSGASTESLNALGPALDALGETPLIAGRYTPEELDAVNPHTQWIRDATPETSE